MKKIRVFINGFGRIGRVSAKILSQEPDVEIVGINDLYDKEQMLHLFRYDTIYKEFDRDILKNTLFFKEQNPKNLKIEELEIDILLQCSGVYLSKKSNEIFLEKGVKRVIVSAPCKDNTKTFIMGINEHLYDGETIISASSCSANAIVTALAPLQKRYGIKSAQFSMIHSYTADQNLLDLKHSSNDLRRARSASMNVLPLQSSASKAVENILRELKGKTTAISVRVPLASCTFYDLTLFLEKDSSYKSLYEIFKNAKSNYLDITDKPCVSSDFIKNTHSCVIDMAYTTQIKKNLVKIGAWQDNEYAYAARLSELSLLIAKSL